MNSCSLWTSWNLWNSWFVLSAWNVRSLWLLWFFMTGMNSMKFMNIKNFMNSVNFMKFMNFMSFRISWISLICVVLIDLWVALICAAFRWFVCRIVLPSSRVVIDFVLSFVAVVTRRDRFQGFVASEYGYAYSNYSTSTTTKRATFKYVTIEYFHSYNTFILSLNVFEGLTSLWSVQHKTYIRLICSNTCIWYLCVSCDARFIHFTI